MFTKEVCTIVGNSKGKDFQVEVKGSLIMNDSVFMLDSVLNGVGLMYTVEELVRDKIESGKLEVVLSEYGPKSEGFYLYYPTRAQVQPKLRAFLDYIKSDRK